MIKSTKIHSNYLNSMNDFLADITWDIYLKFI